LAKGYRIPEAEKAVLPQILISNTLLRWWVIVDLIVEARLPLTVIHEGEH
jgi:hypothetical protein